MGEEFASERELDGGGEEEKKKVMNGVQAFY